MQVAFFPNLTSECIQQVHVATVVTVPIFRFCYLKMCCQHLYSFNEPESYIIPSHFKFVKSQKIKAS